MDLNNKYIPWYEWLYTIDIVWTCTSIKTWKVKSPYKDKDWYFHVTLYKNGKQKHYSIHRLVAQAFIQNSENKPQVNHKNGIKNDNRVDNLEWVTASENATHSYKELWNKSLFQKNHPHKWLVWKDHFNSKVIYQFSLDWTFIKKWFSIADIKRELWIYNIPDCCRWKRKSSWWFIWKYTYDNIKI